MTRLLDEMNARLEAMRDQATRARPQARMVVPSWVVDALDALHADERAGVLAEVESVARAFGLATPVVYYVADEPKPGPDSPG